MVKKTIAVIPARGGSKRIPSKNIMQFRGKPMIAWTIQAALESERFDHVLVSTDSPEIRDVGLELGASVPFLRQGAADDFTPVSEATIAAVRQAEEHWQIEFKTIVQLMPNCPLRTSSDISDALDRFHASGTNFQISCFQFGWMNPWWAAQVDGDGRPVPLFPEQRAMRSQDLPSLFCPTGAIWIADRDALIAAKTFYGERHIYFSMPWSRAVDIDNVEDVLFANAVAELV